MSRQKPKDKRLLVAKEMPPLTRSLNGRERYSYKTDAVYKWLSERPGLIGYVFDKLVAAGYIVYDEERNVWQGVDFQEEDDD